MECLFFKRIYQFENNSKSKASLFGATISSELIDLAQLVSMKMKLKNLLQAAKMIETPSAQLVDFCLKN